MLKAGLFGIGHLGKIHLRLLKEIEEIEVVGFYDPKDEEAIKIESELGLKRFLSEDELLDACDMIDIVTPTVYHYDLASRAIRRSKHVFIEKPVTNTLEEARQLIQLRDEANVKVQVGHVERFNPAFLAAKNIELRPMFIETHRLSQFNPRGTDVSVVLDLMIHDIDIVLHVVNSNVKKISASGVSVVSDTPDIANARMEFDNGCVANLTASRISMKNMRKMRMFQKDAYVAIDFLNKDVEVLRMEDTSDENPLALQLQLGNGKMKNIHYQNPVVDKTINSIKMELVMFVDSILHNHPTPVTLDDGYDALNVAYQVIEKIEGRDKGS